MVQNSLTEFVERIRSLVEDVGNVQNVSFRKVLYLVMLDGLSSLRFPDYTRARDRFTHFIQERGEWADGVRISLPQADLLLRETPRTDPALVSAVSDRLSKWPSGRFQDLGADPFPHELTDPQQLLRECQHIWLLWALRNTLLHEFRHPGYGSDLSETRDAPYYHQVTFLDGGMAGQSGWELVIPAEFLGRLTVKCLDGLARWLQAEHIDPRTVGYQGRSWIGKLRRINPEAAGNVL